MNMQEVRHLPGAMRLLLTSGVISALHTMAMMGQMVLLARVITGVFLEGATLADEKSRMVLLLGLGLIRSLFSVLRDILAARHAGQVRLSLRKGLLQHLYKLGPSYAKANSAGELTNLTMDAPEQVGNYLEQVIPLMSSAVVTPVFILALVSRTDWLSAIVLVVTAPLSVVLLTLVGWNTRQRSERQWQTQGILSGHFLDVVRGLKTLHVFSRSALQANVIETVSEQHRKSTMSTLRLAFLSAFVMEFFTTLSTAVVAVSLGLRLQTARIGLYEALLVLILTPEFYAPIRTFGAQFHASMSGLTAARKVAQVMREEPRTMEFVYVEESKPALVSAVRPMLERRVRDPACAPNTQRALNAERAHLEDSNASPATLELHGISFTYSGRTEPALADVSLTIEAGDTVALVGHTGAGKSTLLDVISGLLRPDAGSIRYGGELLANLPASWWRNQIGLTTQEVFLFPGTIRENIAMGKPGATDAEVQEAASRAGAHEFINAFADGYNTLIGEAGARLSRGQRQRVAMARMLLKDAPIWLLDEPTAHLDVESEGVIRDILRAAGGHRIIIVAAHRLRTVQAANRVVILQKGRIVEYGTPGELLTKRSHFRQFLSDYAGVAEL